MPDPETHDQESQPPEPRSDSRRSEGSGAPTAPSLPTPGEPPAERGPSDGGDRSGRTAGARVAAGRDARAGDRGRPIDEAADDPIARLRRLERGLERAAGDCTLLDARRLRRRVRGLMNALRGDPGRSPEASRLGGRRESLAEVLGRLEADWERARQRRVARQALVPRPTYPPDLPVAQRRDEIVAALRRERVLVVCGDTGSGKSTQLPKMCLEAGRGVAGAIAHTQPRRIAARSVAARVAEELGVPLGGVVGVKTRFDDRTGPNTLVSVLTDGMLLAETRHDRELLAYDTIIVDEAHERSLNIDFLLGYLRRLLERRRDLSLVITSATIDPERFAAHFGGAPILSVEGRTYPIETRWRPVERTEEVDEEDPALLEAILQAVEEIDGSPRAAARPGGDRRRDVLAFLSGEREIREAAEALRGRQRDSEILPLYARLSAEEQDRVFRPSQRRRIVLATNVAETSITVPGIDAVIDPGLARVSRYSPRGRVQRLPIERISQASADQRRGRCGRTGPGICVRLYGEEDFAGRHRYTQPEILRTNLASVILQMASLGLGRPEEFPFLDPPSQRLILAGYQTLVELGAVSKRHEITPLGRRMAVLPVDPRVSRMILASIDEHCLEEVLVIAAALSVQDPRERPTDKANAADFAQLAFRDERSDFLGFLKLWTAWRERSAELGSSALRRWCRDHFLSWLRMREWGDVHRQLRELVRERILPMHVAPQGGGQSEGRRSAVPETALAAEPDVNAVHRALLAGLVGNVGCKGEKNEYRSSSGGDFVLHPSSVLARKTPHWVMAAEIVETSRRFARLCAKIQPDWIERIAGHLCQRSHSEPHWLKDAGQVAAWEKVAVGTLTVVPKRRVPFGPVDPAAARDIFIQFGLVEGELRTQGSFLQHNANVLASIELLQAKGRHSGLVVDNAARYAFYDARIPPDVHSQPSFERWRRDAERSRAGLLHMRAEDLLKPGTEAPDAARFPDVLVAGGLSLDLAYRHAPGEADDGVTVRVPVAAVNRIDPERLEWLVPGLLEEKVAELLRALPKRLRVRFQPAAEFAAGAAETLRFGEGPLTLALARHLSALSGVAVEPGDFDLSHVPGHLRMRVLVVDGEKVLFETRDALEAVRRFRDRAAGEFRSAVDGVVASRQRIFRSGMREWTCDALPEEIPFVRDGVPLVGYPCLVDDGAACSVGLLERRDAAERSHRRGLRRFLALRFASALSHHVEYFPHFERLALDFSPLGPRDLLARTLIDLAVELGFLAGWGTTGLPRDAAAFERLASAGEGRLFAAAREAASLAEPLLRAYHETARALDGHHPPSWEDAVKAMRSEFRRLMPGDVFTSASVERLRHLPRYVSAIRVRLRRLAGNVERDRELQAEIDRWTAHLAAVPLSAPPDVVERYRMLLEEYRVQLFAGELRTAVPVSPERLAAAWEAVRG